MTDLLVFWAVCMIIAAGGINASIRDGWALDSREAREYLGLAILLSVAGPLAFLVSFLLTGFFASGWTLSCASNLDEEE